MLFLLGVLFLVLVLLSSACFSELFWFLVLVSRFTDVWLSWFFWFLVLQFILVLVYSGRFKVMLVLLVPGTSVYTGSCIFGEI